MQISALPSTAQTTRISMQATNVNIREAFREIERSSGISFLFYDDAVDLKRNITVSANDCPLPELLDRILKDTKLTYKVYDDKFIVVTPAESAQQQSISGVITDASTNEALPGVNVTVEGTTLGVVSDLDGKFALDVPSSGSILVFSFVGYNTERVTLSGQTTVNVSLVPDIQSLEEVVVVGSGTHKKVNMTGSVSAVKVDEKITSRD